jgi:hypothetical protein
MNLLAQSTTTTTTDPTGAMAAVFGGSFLIFFLIAAVITIAIYYVILNKAGFNPWLSLLCLIPGLGPLIIIIMLVFTEWPVQRELRACRAQAGGGYAPPPGYPPAGGYAPPPSGGYAPPPPGGPITPA